MSPPHFALVSAFSASPAGGNLAAVVWSGAPLAEGAMVGLAASFAQPATAFLSGEDEFTLRWFNASGELALCGHGAVAAAHVLRGAGRLDDGGAVAFAHPTAGQLSVRADARWLYLSLETVAPTPIAPDPALAAALSVMPVTVTRGALDLIVELDSEQAVAELRPDFARLRAVDTRGVIVTAPAASGEADYVMRFFAPRLGIDEDAVTGTAHAALARFWGPRLQREELLGRQLSARGGSVRTIRSDERVEVAGQAVTLVEGALAERWP